MILLWRNIVNKFIREIFFSLIRTLFFYPLLLFMFYFKRSGFCVCVCIVELFFLKKKRAGGQRGRRGGCD